MPGVLQHVSCAPASWRMGLPGAAKARMLHARDLAAAAPPARSKRPASARWLASDALFAPSDALAAQHHGVLALPDGRPLRQLLHGPVHAHWRQGPPDRG